MSCVKQKLRSLQYKVQGHFMNSCITSLTLQSFVPGGIVDHHCLNSLFIICKI